MPNVSQPGCILLEDGCFKFKFDGAALWESIYKAVIGFANNEFGNVGDAIVGGLMSISATSSLDHKAYTLVYNSLQRACGAVLNDLQVNTQRLLLENIVPLHMASTDFFYKLRGKISSDNYTITSEFFKAPQHHPLLIDAKVDFVFFLRNTFKMHKVQADVIAAMFPGKFTYELAHEWECHDYKAIKTHLNDNPFLEALQKEAKREKRHTELLRRFVKPAFNDPRITLAEMYIPPHFWVHVSCIPPENLAKEFEVIKIKPREQNLRSKQEESTKNRFDFYQHKKHYDLHKFFLNWLRGKMAFELGGEEERLIMLLGHPGQGKTSFSLRTIDQLLREHPDTVQNIYLVRLSAIMAVGKLLDDPLETLLSDHIDLKDQLPGKLLLLLDGLDELHMSQGLTLDQIQEFVRKLRRGLKERSELDLRILLTSRTNYIKLDNHGYNDYIVLHLAELEPNQQEKWLILYKKRSKCWLTTAILSDINNKIGKPYDQLRELVSQPILLQMIAVADVEITTSANSALIYQLLFDKLIKREWSEDYQLAKYENLTVEDLRRFLQTLALNIFQKSAEQQYVRRTDFENKHSPLHLEIKQLAEKMDLKKLPFKDFARNLLISSYFQEVQRDSDEKKMAGDYDVYAYEFLHESLQEYLAAEKIWEECFSELLDKKDRRQKYRIDEAKEVMELLGPLFGPKILSQDISDYLYEIVHNNREIDKKRVLKQRLKLFFQEFLEQIFFGKYELWGGAPYAMENMLGCFYGYWCLVSYLIGMEDFDLRNEEQLYILRQQENILPANKKNRFASLLTLLQREYPRRLILCFQDLSGADFRGVDFPGTDFRGANLRGAKFNSADLSGADFRGADLRRTIFYNTDLTGAKFESADVREANFTHAQLEAIEDMNTANNTDTAIFNYTIYESEFSIENTDKNTPRRKT